MTLRPVIPGHVAVRPRPKTPRAGTWCIVTVGPVKHYSRPVEVDGNPYDPQVLLHCYEFISRDVALYAARLILDRGWLHQCDEPYPDDLSEAQKNRCVRPLGHEGMHGNGYYRWTPENWVPASYGTPQHIEFDRGELKMWPDIDVTKVQPESVLKEARELYRKAGRIDLDTSGVRHSPGQQDEAGRCEEIDTWSKDTVQCQLPAGHEGMHRHRTGPELTATVTQWRSRKDLDRDVEHWLARAPHRPLPVTPVMPFRALCRARTQDEHTLQTFSCNKDLYHPGIHHFTPEGPTQ